MYPAKGVIKLNLYEKTCITENLLDGPAGLCCGENLQCAGGSAFLPILYSADDDESCIYRGIRWRLPGFRNLEKSVWQYTEHHKEFPAEKTTNKNANIGFNLVNQVSSDGAYSFTNGYLTFAYTGVRFGKNADHYLVMAMQIGFISRKFDITKMQFGSQWVSGVGFDASSTSNETFLKPQVTSFDAGAGIAYYDATPNKTASFFGGIAAYHITQPVKSVFIRSEPVKTGYPI